MTTFRSKALPLATLALLAGCGGEPEKAAVPEPTPTPVASATPAASPEARLAAAVKAAFPNEVAVEDKDGQRFTFSDHRLIDAPFGVVLASEGQADNPGHVTAGRIDLTYLTPSGRGFTVAKRFPAAVVQGSFGQMSDWTVRNDLADVPVIAASGGFTGQGYTCGSTGLTELRPDGPVEVADVKTVYSDDGAVEGPAVKSFEGKLTNVSPDGFDVAFTGTRSFTEHYARSGGKFVRQGPAQLPAC